MARRKFFIPDIEVSKYYYSEEKLPKDFLFPCEYEDLGVDYGEDIFDEGQQSSEE